MGDDIAGLPLVEVTSRHPPFLIMNRRPELVSGSIYEPRPVVCEVQWTLERSHRQVKQVKGDEEGG